MSNTKDTCVPCSEGFYLIGKYETSNFPDPNVCAAITVCSPGKYYTITDFSSSECEFVLRGIWYSWVNTFSYFLNPHGINVLLYEMKPRKHTQVKYCWQAYFKFIGTFSQTFKNHIHNKWCVPSASDVFLSENDNSGGKTR